MFEQLQIRIKRGSRVTSPDDNWTASDKLYCGARLTVGFGEIFDWNDTDLLPLQKLVAFYHDLGQSVRSSAPTAFQYSFPYRNGSVQLHWTIQPHAQLNFTISYRQGNREREVLSKPVDIPAIILWMDTTYETILTQVTEIAPPAISLMVGELFSPGPHAGFRFGPGQKVRTVLSTQVRQLHIGYILHRIRQDDDNNNYYQILVNGKPLKRRYLEEELEPIT
ncbi:hypothetical protein [Paraflavitalea pollutisoli]|uniref:hypothetical protein n=1 Tax=Paraflavitalea pollutisoli TaxID=3034143 RepID=UPI0023EB0F24|nr:hypothetical protein [Paraflavitalea sp. H1-2-19X]